ncbi:hypothetical protein IPJ72_03175 [Candidatus Peregrinibacteria bacterium]|nr:MAG: hypothetical protein IPJ72_03175 [Candidatus Peregrinibacteria bacterium]
MLTLKFAEIDLIKAQTGETPVLLLDDVFSELDDARQRILFKEIAGIQTFITTTHEAFLDVVEGEKIIYKVKEGEIIKS